MEVQIQLKNLIRLIEALQVLAFFFGALGMIGAFRGASLPDVLVRLLFGFLAWIGRYPLINIFNRAFDEFLADSVREARKEHGCQP